MKRFMLFARSDRNERMGFEDFVADFDSFNEAASHFPDGYPGLPEARDRIQIVDQLLRLSFNRFWDEYSNNYTPWVSAVLPGPVPELWYHVKRSKLYVIDRRGGLQIAGPEDGAEVVGYTDVQSSQWWCRTSAEFADGRFVMLTLDMAESDPIKGLLGQVICAVAKDIIQRKFGPICEVK